MHETYRILAQTLIDQRLREAADARRAAEARRATRPGDRLTRVQRLLSHFPNLRDQRTAAAPAAAATLSADGTCSA
jgi:hypothetical protein